MSLVLILLVVGLSATGLNGCARHTYIVELTDGSRYYADPPLDLDREGRVYHLWIAGRRYTVPLDDVANIGDANQICYKNVATDTFTCFDALYQY